MYHAFGATTYAYVSSEYRGGSLFFHLTKKHRRRCPACRSRRVTLDGRVSYTVRTIPIGWKAVFLVLHLHMLLCEDCGARTQERRDVADPRKSYTRAFARYVIDLAKEMTLSAIATRLGVGWDLVKEIVKSRLSARAKQRSWRKIRRIGIDEFATHKGHRYMTVVVDLDTGRVLYTAEGKDHTTLEAFFARLKKARAKLQAIAVDMSEAYAKAIRLYAPAAAIVVHDHFHVVKEMNEVLTEVRRDEQRRLADEGKSAIKGSRYLLLMGQEKLEKEPEKKTRLDALLAANDTLHRAYLLKEDLRLFWKQESKVKASDFIDTWLEEAKAMNNTHVARIAKTIEAKRDAILAWYDHPISTGPVEGLNNKIKVLKRKAYGYRDMEFFSLQLLFLHEAKATLTGV